MIVAIALGIYVAGFFASLWIFHTFKKELDIDNYDPPHPLCYDDYNSNAEAFLSFSTFWPFTWIIFTFALLYRGMLFISKSMEK